MFYLVVIARPLDWTAGLWFENPPEGKVIKVHHLTRDYEEYGMDNAPTLADAQETARGFNEMEMKTPKGLWSIVSTELPVVGQIVEIENVCVLN